VLLQRSFEFNPRLRQVTIRYFSVNDSRKPETDAYVRAVSPHTMWRFTVLHDDDDDEGEEEEDDDNAKNDSNSYLVSDNDSVHDHEKQPKEKEHQFTDKKPTIQSTSVVSTTTVVTEPITPSDQLVSQQHQQPTTTWWKRIKSRLSSWAMRSQKQHNADTVLVKVNVAKRELDAISSPTSLLTHTPYTSLLVHRHSHRRRHGHGQCTCEDTFRGLGGTIPMHARNKQRRLAKTFVEVETMVDSKGSIPKSFMNYMQRYGTTDVLSILVDDCFV
jgi:hypothetical protein